MPRVGAAGSNQFIRCLQLCFDTEVTTLIIGWLCTYNGDNEYHQMTKCGWDNNNGAQKSVQAEQAPFLRHFRACRQRYCPLLCQYLLCIYECRSQNNANNGNDNKSDHNLTAASRS